MKNLMIPDDRSKAWTPEWVYNEFVSIPISEKVQGNIKEMIDLAQQLAYYGYFKYEFYDIAIFYLCLSLEAALRTKYNNSNNKLSLLVKKAKRDKLFPTVFESKVDNIKRMRDNHAHPSGMTVMPLFIRAFHLTIYLINCIYDSTARKRLPPLFEKEIQENKRNRILYDALFRISNYKIPVGQAFEVAGASRYYERGKYTCAKCGSIQVVDIQNRELLPCSVCKETIFLYRYEKYY